MPIKLAQRTKKISFLSRRLIFHLSCASYTFLKDFIILRIKATSSDLKMIDQLRYFGPIIGDYIFQGWLNSLCHERLWRQLKLRYWEWGMCAVPRLALILIFQVSFTNEELKKTFENAWSFIQVYKIFVLVEI